MIKLYIDAIKKTFFDIKRSWMIIPASFVFIIISVMILKVFLSFAGHGTFSIGGFLAGMFGILSLSILYSWVKVIASGQKFNFNHIKDFDISFFDPILSVAFMLFIASLFFMANKSFLVVINFIIIIIFNAVPETILFKDTRSLETFSQSFNFIIKNWIEWFVPQFIILLPIIFVSPKNVLFLFGVSDILIPSGIIFNGIYSTFNIYTMNVNSGGLGGGGVISFIVAFLISLFFTIFRVHLYYELDTTNKRARKFK